MLLAWQSLAHHQSLTCVSALVGCSTCVATAELPLGLQTSAGCHGASLVELCVSTATPLIMHGLNLGYWSRYGKWHVAQRMYRSDTGSSSRRQWAEIGNFSTSQAAAPAAAGISASACWGHTGPESGISGEQIMPQHPGALPYSTAHHSHGRAAATNADRQMPTHVTMQTGSRNRERIR